MWPLTQLALAAPPTDGVHRVANGDVTVWTRAEGTASDRVPVLMVHGGPGMTSFPFEHTVGPLIARDRPVIYADDRGAGRSDRPAGPEHYSFELLADDLEHIREAYGQEQLVVLGHSNGAAVALTYARTHPDRVAALVLLCPLISPADLEANMVKKLAGAPASERGPALAVLRSGASIEERFLGVLDALPPDFRHSLQFVDDADQARFDRIMARFARETGLESTMTGDLFTGMRRSGFFAFDAYAFADQLTMPVLVLVGADDSELSTENSMRFAVSVPDGTFVSIDDAGHHPYLEQTALVAEALDAFLSR